MKNIISSPLEIQCSFMEKINYQLEAFKTFEEVDKLDKKPTLLIHACCAPCSSHPLTILCDHFDVTIYYNNSNIYPESEYNRRLEELKRFLKCFEKDFHHHVKLIVPPYDNEKYNETLEPLKDIKEGGLRCFTCYEKRMDEAYKFASENHYDYFCTIMTISRQKSSQKLNEIGKTLQEKYPNCKYLFSDFKKNNGLLHVKELKAKYDLYQQLYCGCKYSYESRQNYDKNHQK